ncbi:hypothetical protein KSP39_PZI015078 [Platanthera zijinensis]|uniref:Plastid lipid-associated protein/fibrillin conserved domain-containing protein n=1 Tax=Platanthera zijinensis TaxID=2320716 RepID=A0AAP0G2Z3_9ASPA
MAVGVARLGFPLLTSWRSTPSSSRSRPVYSKSTGRRPRLHSIFASLAEDERGVSFTEPEVDLIDALVGIQGRGRSATDQQLKDVGRAVEALENLKGIADPTNSDLIEGRWQLVFTTRPGTASPIQRTFVGVDIFKIFQEVYLRTKDPRVTNTVQFSNQIGELRVEKVTRQGQWHASSCFHCSERLQLQLRMERESFFSLTEQLSPSNFCLLRFHILCRLGFLEMRQRDGWTQLICQLVEVFESQKGTSAGYYICAAKGSSTKAKITISSVFWCWSSRCVIDAILSKRSEVRADLEALDGEWQLLWSSQASVDNWKVAAAANSLKGLEIVKKNGNLENHNTLFPGFRLCTSGRIVKSEANRFEATTDAGAYFLGPVRFPVEIKSNYSMEVLYIDHKIRISRQNEAIMMIHLRVGNSEGNQI